VTVTDHPGVDHDDVDALSGDRDALGHAPLHDDRAGCRTQRRQHAGDSAQLSWVQERLTGMRRLPGLAGAIAVALAATACGTTPVTSSRAGGTQASITGTVHKPGRPLPAWAVRRLTALADRIVKANGDHPVQWAEAVVTTRANGLRTVTPGDWVPGPDYAVFVLVIKGQFECGTCSYPSGAHAPTGTYAAFSYDAKNFHGESDSSIGNRPPPIPLSRLGPVTYLHVHP
jgi:hypothetical protein